MHRPVTPVIHFMCNIQASYSASTLRYANDTLAKYGVRSSSALAACPNSLAQSVELHFRLQTHTRTPAVNYHHSVRGLQRDLASRRGQQGKHAFSTAGHMVSSLPSTHGRDAGEAQVPLFLNFIFQLHVMSSPCKDVMARFG